MTPVDSKATLRRLEEVEEEIYFYSLGAAETMGITGVSSLPLSLKCLLENLLRQHAEGRSDGSDIVKMSSWLHGCSSEEEIDFYPTRMLIPESSGLPLFGDLAAMREAAARFGADPAAINPVVPVDFIVDHSSNVDVHGRADAAVVNVSLEIDRNRERYRFLRWVAQAFDHLRVFPPGSGICHQINLEYLARVVWTRTHDGRTIAFPDSLIGMDSHTPMINSMGVIGWGVGGLDGGAVALGQPVMMRIPEVVGVRLHGQLPAGTTATDLVLAITQRLRQEALQGMFIEYLGKGLSTLSLADRATVANMTPECGATVSFFPVDERTLTYLRQTGRSEKQISLVRAYSKAQGLWHDPEAPEPAYTKTISFDLSQVVPCVSGPARPHQRISLSQAAHAFEESFAVSNANAARPQSGDIVMAAITSCTNTSNPALMIGAALLARNAVRRGLRSRPWVKTSLAPGSLVVADYLRRAGLQDSLDALGFHVVGFGCMTCMGNSGPLLPGVTEMISRDKLDVVAVLSGNRNFEGRIHTSVRANFLASPPLVVAYALAGSIRIDLSCDPLAFDDEGKPVFLSDIWPADHEIEELLGEFVTNECFLSTYSHVLEGPSAWREIDGKKGVLFEWDADSTFIRRPPFFDNFKPDLEPIPPIRGARVLAMLGDMVTTDHISPIGSISEGTPADRYLQSRNIAREDYVNYAARRLNHQVMIGGTFANVRLQNEMTPGVTGSSTVHYPDEQQMPISDAAELYRTDGVPLVIVAGREYGAGSSRDWAAKGTQLLGVRAVFAESFERIHRSNLAAMGILPLEFCNGDSRKSLDLQGNERFDIEAFGSTLTPRQTIPVLIRRNDGSTTRISVLLRLETQLEVEYFEHGGFLHHRLRHQLSKGKPQ